MRGLFRGSAVLAIAAGFLSCSGAAVADNVSVSYSQFGNITNNAGNPNIASQLQVDVRNYDYGGNSLLSNQVAIVVHNLAGGLASSIARVYFEDGTLVGIASIHQFTGGSGHTDFEENSSPSDLPGGNSLNPQFDSTREFNIGANSPPPVNGVNPGEWVEVVFNLKGTYVFSDVLDAIDRGFAKTNGESNYGMPTLRIGMHIISIDGGNSDSYLMENPQLIPLPAPLALAMVGLAGVVVISTRRRLPPQ